MSDEITHAPGLKEKIMKGGAFMAGRQLISMGLSLIGVLIITRVIGPEKYGAYAAALGIYQYVQNLGQAGIGVYLVRSHAQPEPREYHAATTLLLLLSSLLALIVTGGIGLLDAWVNVAGMRDILLVLMLPLLAQTMAVAASARLERELNFRRVAIIEIGGQLLYYAFALPLAIAGFGAWSLAIGWCMQQLAMCIAFHIAAGYVPKLVWDTARMRQMLKFTAGFSVANWLWQLRTLVNPLIVGHFLNAEAVGQVGIAIRLMELLAFIKTVAWRLSIAALAKIQHSKEKLTEAITHGMQLQMLALGPVLVGFGWFGDWILPRLFGERWLPVMELYPYLALSYLTNAQFNMHSSALYVLQRNREVSLFHIVHMLLFAGVTWVSVERVGLIGYGYGEIAALTGYGVIHMFVTRAIGRPDYRISGLWWLGLALGLFWRQLGLWAVAAPFLALLSPPSLKQLREYYRLIRRKNAHAA